MPHAFLKMPHFPIPHTSHHKSTTAQLPQHACEMPPVRTRKKRRPPRGWKHRHQRALTAFTGSGQPPWDWKKQACAAEALHSQICVAAGQITIRHWAAAWACTNTLLVHPRITDWCRADALLLEAGDALVGVVGDVGTILVYPRQDEVVLASPGMRVGKCQSLEARDDDERGEHGSFCSLIFAKLWCETELRAVQCQEGL